MNVDAAFNCSSGKVGIGIVVRNSAGLLVCAAGLSSCLATSTAIAKAKAILMGAQFAVKKGLSPVCIVSDALKVVNMCNDSSPSRCDLSNIIHDIKVICNCDNFDSYSYNPRSSNMVAHCIAKWALVHCSSTVWESVFPSWLRDCSDTDVSIFFGPGGA
ncbi:hypothetical protein ACOSQ4_024994 [Xanthoceras sorbifolium]